MGFDRFASWKLEDGLWLEAQKGGATYRARASVKGRKGYLNTGQRDRDKADRVARKWFRQFAVEAQGNTSHTMQECADLHAENFPAERASAKASFLTRWNAIKAVKAIGKTQVRDIDTRWLREFLNERDVKEVTRKKDLDTIRPCLRVAHEHGWIDQIPTFPKTTPTRNPNYPFTLAEWERLRTHMLGEIKKSQRRSSSRVLSSIGRHTDLGTAQYVYDYAMCMVYGLLRPKEVYRLTVNDVTLEGASKPPRMGWRVRRKTGLQGAVVWSRSSELDAILHRRLTVAKENGQTRLFWDRSARFFSDTFGEMLDDLHLRKPVGSDNDRDSWSLRASGICFEIVSQRRTRGTADLLDIARRAGTSVARIDLHYAAFLDDVVQQVMPPGSTYIGSIDEHGRFQPANL